MLVSSAVGFCTDAGSPAPSVHRHAKRHPHPRGRGCLPVRPRPSARNVLFLASALPPAERAARKRAAKIFVHPSDLQIELMYGGAVEAVIAVFQSKSELKPEDNAFRR
jgi:hypothetical protein